MVTEFRRVLFRSIHGRSRQRHCSEAPLVVLCASTIESLRLLLHSQQVGGLEEVSGLLGRGLMDHVSTSCFFALPEQPAPEFPRGWR
jgi:choline dehydrogenase-like flavoprotein